MCLKPCKFLKQQILELKPKFKYLRETMTTLSYYYITTILFWWSYRGDNTHKMVVRWKSEDQHCLMTTCVFLGCACIFWKWNTKQKRGFLLHLMIIHEHVKAWNLINKYNIRIHYKKELLSYPQASYRIHRLGFKIQRL